MSKYKPGDALYLKEFDIILFILDVDASEYKYRFASGFHKVVFKGYIGFIDNCDIAVLGKIGQLLFL